MAPLPLHPKRLLLAGMLAGAVSVLPASATFGKGRSRPAVLPRPISLLVPVPVSPPVLVPEPPTDALFYDIPPRSVDPEWLAQIRCDSAATAEESPGKVAVDFSGYVTWQNERFPEELPTPTFLSIELQDASLDGKVEDRPLLYLHRQEISDVYDEGEPVEFAFCAKVPDVEQYGLYARVLSAASADMNMNTSSATSSQLSFAGLTDIEAGLKAYNDVRVRLFKAIRRDSQRQAHPEKYDMAADEPMDSTAEAPADDIPPASDAIAAEALSSDAVKAASTSVPSSVEVCNFSDLQPDIRGVAARVIMEVPSSLATSTTLPKPTVLTVLLEEVNPQVDSSALITEPLAVFSSDITEWYSAGEELTAVLCAQIPARSEKAAIPYKLRSLLNVGWDGYDELEDRDAKSDPGAEDEPLQKLRSGDYMAEATVIVVPNKDSYVVKAPLVPYDS